MTIEDKYSTGMVINKNLSATITNININGSVNNFNHTENCSVNSSMSSSSSCCSIMQQQNNLIKIGNESNANQSLPRFNLDEKPNSQADNEKEDLNTIFIRVSISDQNIQV